MHFPVLKLLNGFWVRNGALLACFGLSLQATAATNKPQSLETPKASEKVQSLPGKLDTAAAHATYADGDFDQVVATLEPYLTQKLPMSRAESLFVFKHLGVIFSKDAPSREKGKYCFRKLFDLNPEAQILDMYATDDIYAVFRTVRDEWLLSHPEYVSASSSSAPNSAAMANATSAPAAPSQTNPAAASQANARPKHNDEWKIWSIAGGAAVVTQPDEKTKTTFVVDPLNPAP
jgi:hypothetical protein